MERVNKILVHKEYQRYMTGIRQQEQNRQFCRHGLEHCLDVARIGYIRNLEQQLGIKKDVIYAAALLHDIGRFEEYTSGKSHHAESARLAAPILRDCAYNAEECMEICEAIDRHKEKTEGRLAMLLYEADKMSRSCFDCPAIAECYWEEEKKNYHINI